MTGPTEDVPLSATPRWDLLTFGETMLRLSPADAGRPEVAAASVCAMQYVLDVYT